MSGKQTSDNDPDEAAGFNRREALKRVGTGGLSVLGAGVVVGSLGSRAAAGDDAPGAPGDGQSDEYGAGLFSDELPVGAAAGPYGGEYAPPEHTAADALDHLTFPPAPRSGTVEVEMAVVEVPIEVSRAHTVAGWTYNGTAPGPTIRATEGDLIRVHFSNRTNHDHNLHFHGSHSPQHDGWEPIPPGGETVYEIVAGPAGVHPYHCHTMPINRHISKGLYGTLIVDPPEARPDAHEVVLALSGWDIDDDGHNELYSWNGIAGFFQKYPIKVPAGELVRAYVLNMTEFDPIASFHLHAQTFAVYPAGMGSEPAFASDVVTFGQMDRAILEFELPQRGRYMFHPHQHSIAQRGAMGWFSAT